MTPLLLAKIGALAAVPAMVVATVIGPQVLVVDVREAGPGGTRLVIPVPIAAMRLGAALAPESVRTVELDTDTRELERILPVALRLVDELESIPDTELVRVEDGAQTVSVTKTSDELRVHVTAPDEEVRVRVAIPGVRRVLESMRGGTVQLGALVGALGEVARGDLIYVRSGSDVVKIKVW
jgi:hypothetical protein